MPQDSIVNQKENEQAGQLSDYEQLRSLLLGNDYEQVLQQRLDRPDTDRIAEVISEAFTKRNQLDDSLAKEISPVIEDSIDTSIKNHPERITNVIFPIIGPAVRKAVSSALSDLMYSLNHLLQHSLSVRSLIWRFKAWRLGVPYGQYVLLQTIQYQVEQVFLIHKETSVLIQSASIQGINYQDPDLVSSMLAAITDFANDSFTQQSDSLNVLQFGDLSLLIETGPHAVVAFAVRGILHNDVKKGITELLEKIHAEFAPELRIFDGDTSKFETCVEWLEKALVKKEKSKQESKPWMAIVTVFIISSLLGYFSYQKWQLNNAVKQVIETVNKQPGYQVLNDNYHQKELHLVVLQSPLAKPTNELISSFSELEFKLTIDAKLAALGSAELFVPYLSHKYNSDLTLGGSGAKPNLVVAGIIEKGALAALKQDIIVKRNFNLVVSEDLKYSTELSNQDKDKLEFDALINQINNQYYYFESGSANLNELSREKLNTVISQLQRLIQIQASAGYRIGQISVSGYADSQGGSLANQSISSDRARLIGEILKANGIKDKLIISWGYGSKDLDTLPVELQRRARIEVFYMPNKSIRDD